MTKRLDQQRVLGAVKCIAIIATPIGQYALLLSPYYSALFIPVLVAASPYLAVCALAATCAGLGLAPWIEDMAWWRLFLVTATLTAALLLAMRGRLFLALNEGSRFHALRYKVALTLRKVVTAGAVLLASSLLVRSVPVIHALCWTGLYMLVRRALPKPPPAAWTWRGAIGSALLLLLGLIVALTVFEIGARLLWGAPVPIADQPHPDRIRTLRPGSVGKYRFISGRRSFEWRSYQVSSLGIRDREIGAKGPDEFRILLLGDSFVFGYGLDPEQTLSWCLKERLEADRDLWPRQMVVINGGVGGYAPWQELSLLRELAPKLKPDLVILQLLLSNDISETLVKAGKHLRAHNEKDTQARMLLFFYKGPLVRLHQWFYSYSAAYRALWYTEAPPYLLVQSLQRLRFSRTSNLPRVLPSEERPVSLETDLADWYPELQEGAAMLAQDVRHIRDYCVEQGIDLIGFAVPAGQSVSEYWWRSVLREKTVYYEAGKDARVGEEIFADAAIPYVPLFPIFQQCAYWYLLYFLHDLHFSPLGADVVTAELADYLKHVYLPGKLGLRAPVLEPGADRIRDAIRIR